MREMIVNHSREQRLEQLIDRLPARVQAATRWLRRPSSRWARVPAGVLLIIGGLLSILPVFGLWMLPLGVVLLADDVLVFQRMRDALLDQLERRRPDWFAELKRDRRAQGRERAG
jgi:hypothetical protein